MAYTMLKNPLKAIDFDEYSLEGAALSFIRESCERLRFDLSKTTDPNDPNPDSDGRGIRENSIPCNMEKDIDRLCLENAVARFLGSGKKEDAFDVYYCYLEMFVGDYEKTRRMIELLSEFEVNSSGVLMKHRDHYSHSVYVFCLGLALYRTNEKYRNTYNGFYNLSEEHEAACHYLKYWGLTSLFHDIGYPFELPFEQVASYFEVEGDDRAERPYVAYRALEPFVAVDDKPRARLRDLLGRDFASSDELFAYALSARLSKTYGFTEEQMLGYLRDKATHPENFTHFMDHAYFSATVLFNKLFEDLDHELSIPSIDALTAIIMHNSLYKFSIGYYKKDDTRPFKAELHPLAYMLMLCDELQCWDRTAYGRNSKKELHPMGCAFDFSGGAIKATYLYDENQIGKVNSFKDRYIAWLQKPVGKAPKLKAYSEMFIQKDGVTAFQDDIEHIVDLSELPLTVETVLTANTHAGDRRYLSDSNFMNLHNFAIVLHGRWDSGEWKRAKEAGLEEQFIADESRRKKYAEDFKKLSLEYKLSNINQAKEFAGYLSAIGCFYTDKPVDFVELTSFSEEELLKIGVMEHKRWLQEHTDMGWVYGKPEKDERDRVRAHKDMVPGFTGNHFLITDEDAKANYQRLDKAEQDKDTEPMECMLAMLKMYDGLRIYRL